MIFVRGEIEEDSLHFWLWLETTAANSDGLGFLEVDRVGGYTPGDPYCESIIVAEGCDRLLRIGK